MVDRVGQQLGSYRLIRLLGRGGFAEVYLGEHFRLKSRAAIKVLHAQLSEDDIARFLNEAQTIANLEHPNIVHVLDFDITENTPFLVMGYASEGTLRQRYPKGTRLQPQVILPYVKQIADALYYAHSEKLIHRDIKPENMLLGRHNQVLLSDFGIALIMQSSHYQSLLNTAGTVSYMAPEQIQGKPRPASDQYALGVVIYEWLTGARPFQGSFTEIATQHVLAPPPPLHEKIPDISPVFEQVVLKTLEKDPHRRFADMQEFASAFEQACQNPFIASPTILLSPPLLPVNALAAQIEPSASQKPIILPDVVVESFDSPPMPSQPPQSFVPIVSPIRLPEPSSALPLPDASQRQKWRFSRRTVLIGMICLLLIGGIATGLITGGIQSLFLGGQTSLTGSIVSVNASTGTVVINANGQQETIKNVPASVIQALLSQGAVGKTYSVTVTPNSDGTFSIVSGSNFTLNNTEGTATTNQTSTTNQTPASGTGINEPGSITFYGHVQSEGSNSLVVTMPTGGTLSFTTNSSTDLSDFNGTLPSVGTYVKVLVTANSDGSFTATKIGNVNQTNNSTQAQYTGVTTAAVGSDNILHFRVGNQSFSFPIAPGTSLSAFSNGSIPSGATVSVTVQFNGSNGSVIQISNGNGLN